MAANARFVNIKQLGHSLLRSPNGFVLDNHLHLAFIVGQLV